MTIGGMIDTDSKNPTHSHQIDTIVTIGDIVKIENVIEAIAHSMVDHINIFIFKATHPSDYTVRIVTGKTMNCEDDNHIQHLSEYCYDLIKACIKTGDDCFPNVKSKKTQIPYWNKEVQHLKDNALFWSSIYILCGKPRDGVVAQIMRYTKHRYHYAIRAIKKRESGLHKSNMAEHLLNNRNDRDFWKENNKMSGSFKEMPPHIDGTTEPEGIAQQLSDKHSTIKMKPSLQVILIWICLN